MLCGRSDERGTIGQLLRSARSGRGGALLLHGEAGVGKSALLADAAARARGMIVLSAQGLEAESELAFAGLAALLAPLLPSMAALPAVQCNALNGALALGPPSAGERFTIFQGATTLISNAAQELPVLAIVDDVQWLDGASQQALRFMARRLDDMPVAMILTRRDGDPAEERWHGADEVEVRGERRGEAAAELDRIGAVPWAERTREELASLTGSINRPSASGEEPLTGQEQRIAALVVTGATNKEIADRLFLSPRTVEFHLRGAFRKLGVRSRTQLAAALRGD